MNAVFAARQWNFSTLRVFPAAGSEQRRGLAEQIMTRVV